MMKRLLDGESLETEDLRLAELFRVAAPFEVDPFRKRRILVRLERKGSAISRPLWLRSAIIATLLISGTATAALGHRYVTQGGSFFGSGTSSEAVQEVKAPRRAARPRQAAKAVPAVGAAMIEASPLSASPLSASPSAPPALTPAPAKDVPEAPARSNAPPAKSNLRARADSAEDPSHVVEAIQALRTERDPARAQALLNDYLRAHPHGVLSGDALALSIEAASARHDPRAADYARRYLASYPKGKYRELAKRALEHR